MTSPPPSNPKATGSVFAICAAACVVATGIASHWEGYEKRASPDPVGIPTYCYGETSMLKYDPSHIYAKTECMALLRQRLASDFAPGIRACVPQVVNWQRVKIFGALIDASYNNGVAGVCGSAKYRIPVSPMVVQFRQGHWVAGCKAFYGWHVTARHKPLRGLINRRKDEAKACLEGAK
jgi:lysozyme